MEDYETTIDKNCPRCGSNKVAVKVYQTWTAQFHVPMCAKCGLGAGETMKSSTSEIIAKSVISNFYYEYELRNTNNC